MADSSIILSSAAEAELLKPIDEYVGKIQAQIDELRKDGSDKVRSLKNHIAIVKENKNLTKEVKRDLQGQMKVNKTLDTYYDLIEIYKGLDEYDQEMVWSIMQTVKKAGEKRKRDRENTEES